MEKAPQLERSLTLRGAVTLNLLDMIGVGPFLTLPLLLAAMGGPQAMLGWVLGALLAACDGLVWAELGAMMPEAGGTYAYLGQMFPGRWGRWLSFLFVFQLMFSAPLSVASGCIGLAQYAGFLSPALRSSAAVHMLHVGPYSFGVSAGRANWVAITAVVLAVVLLYRRLSAMRGLATAMLALVLLTLGWAMVTGLLHGHIAQVVCVSSWSVPAESCVLRGAGVGDADCDVRLLGLLQRDVSRWRGARSRADDSARGVALDWDCGGAVPGTECERALGDGLSGDHSGGWSLDARRALLSEFMQMAYAPTLGAHTALLLGRLAALLVMATAFASVFALLLGYSRIPFAAARDGNFPAVFGRLHPTRGFPYIALLTLAGVACLFCFFSLSDVIAALVVLRIVLQFGLQQVGVMGLRIRRPEMARPFRMWLYPLPPLLALLGFGYIVFARVNFGRELLLAGVVAVAGTIVFTLRAASTSSVRPGA